MSDDTREDPIDALTDLFSEPDTEPTPGFVDRLEVDLRIAHADRNHVRQSVPIWGRVGALASMAVLVLAIATAGLVLRDRSVSSALELSNARGVVVTMPDGSVVSDPADGFDLPEGAVIVIEIGGSATIEDVSLPEGTVVTVRDGALVSEVSVTTTVAAPEHRPGGLDADPTVSPHRDGPMPSAIPADEPAPVVPDPPRTVPPAGMDRPGPMATVPADHPAPGSGLDLGLRLRLDARSHRVRIEWSSGPAAEPMWRVVVVRTSGDLVPDWPLAPGAMVVGESVGTGRSEIIDMLGPSGGVVNYRVLVLDEAGGVVARGAIQKVETAPR